MNADSFCWREGGEAILHGLTSLRDAPPFAIGGAVAYKPRSAR